MPSNFWQRLASAHPQSQCKTLQSKMQNSQSDFRKLNSEKYNFTVGDTNCRGFRFVDSGSRCNLHTFGGSLHSSVILALTLCKTKPQNYFPLQQKTLLLLYHLCRTLTLTSSLCSPPTAFDVDKGSPEYHQTVHLCGIFRLLFERVLNFGTLRLL